MSREKFDTYTKEDFITSDEVETIRNKVWELKPYWKNFHTYGDEIDAYIQYKKDNPKIAEYLANVYKTQNFLGDATYVIASDLSYMNQEVRDKLLENFGWVYDRLVSFFKEFYETDSVKLHSSLPYPGFHIFNGEQEENVIYPYHTDKEQHPDDDPEKNSIYSFIILIQNTEDPAHLEYIPPGMVESFDGFKNINSSIVGNKLEYLFNNLYIWRGSMPHRIGAMTLKDSEEARITLQGHIYYDKKDNFYKIYF